MLIQSIHTSLNELKELLRQLSDSEYSKPCPELSNSTIGEHTRHIIEMFQCLEVQYPSGMVNYDRRERNSRIQSETKFANECIDTIQQNLDKENKTLELQQIIDGEEIRIQSNYYRELLYNLEHCIHHQALIKVALLKYQNISVSTNFGVARSTVEYRNQCAQ
jgi:hypothetical protein